MVTNPTLNVFCGFATFCGENRVVDVVVSVTCRLCLLPVQVRSGVLSNLKKKNIYIKIIKWVTIYTLVPVNTLLTIGYGYCYLHECFSYLV